MSDMVEAVRSMIEKSVGPTVAPPTVTDVQFIRSVHSIPNAWSDQSASPLDDLADMMEKFRNYEETVHRFTKLHHGLTRDGYSQEENLELDRALFSDGVERHSTNLCFSSRQVIHDFQRLVTRDPDSNYSGVLRQIADERRMKIAKADGVATPLMDGAL
jgi:hypothetical protein